MRLSVAAAIKTVFPVAKVTRRGFIASARLRSIEDVASSPNTSQDVVRRVNIANGSDNPAKPQLVKYWPDNDLEKYFKRHSEAAIEGKLNDSQELLLKKVRTELAKRLARSRLKGFKQHQTSENAEKLPAFDCLWLRDACDCSICVDPSSKQKTFQTTDIPFNISVETEAILPDGSLQVTWRDDIPGIRDNHVSTYSKGFLSLYRNDRKTVEAIRPQTPRVHWENATISRDVTFFDYSTYMSSDTVLYSALEALRIYGLIFLRGVPSTETAVEDIGGRVGNLKDTFYGRTWDVKSVPEAKNVAYTNVSLGFHMDLLYTTDPPGLQLLHCIHNSCEGGNSLFSDSFHAAEQVAKEKPKHFKALQDLRITYHYHNAGQHYRQSRPVFVTSGANSPQSLKLVNYSPPFQGPFTMRNGILVNGNVHEFRDGVQALSAFAKSVEDPDNMFEYKLKEGECVVFNNRRVLHARRAFDIGSGERWLKGAYVDTDVFESRLRVLHEEREGVAALVPSAVGQVGVEVATEGGDQLRKSRKNKVKRSKETDQPVFRIIRTKVKSSKDDVKLEDLTKELQSVDLETQVAGLDSFGNLVTRRKRIAP